MSGPKLNRPFCLIGFLDRISNSYGPQRAEVILNGWRRTHTRMPMADIEYLDHWGTYWDRANLSLGQITKNRYHHWRSRLK